jgi:hypothetical protein
MKWKSEDCPQGFADSPRAAGDWSGQVHGDTSAVLRARQILAQAQAKANPSFLNKLRNMFRK